MKPATGKLGVMTVGLGAVSTTFITGVLMARKGLAKPIGALTQYDKIRVGHGVEKKYLPMGEIISLAQLNDIVFGAWAVYPANAFESAVEAAVLRAKDILPVEDELKAIRPIPAAFDHNYAKRLDGNNVKDCATRWEMVEALREDIRRFKIENGVDRIVVLWAASTEVYVPVDEAVHYHLADLEAAMKADDRERIAPSMCYAYAALSEGCPFVMGTGRKDQDAHCRQGLQNRTNLGEERFLPHHRYALSGPERMVLDQHFGQPRWPRARRACQFPHQGSVETLNARKHPAGRGSA